MKEQQNAELQRMREQTLLDIEKMKFEMEKQIENYEKTAQVDVTKDIFTNMMMGDSSAFGNIATGLEELGKLQDQLQQFQNKSPKTTNTLQIREDKAFPFGKPIYYSLYS